MLKVIGIDRAAQHVDKVADIAAAWLRDLNRGIMASQARRQYFILKKYLYVQTNWEKFQITGLDCMDWMDR